VKNRPIEMDGIDCGMPIVDFGACPPELNSRHSCSNEVAGAKRGNSLRIGKCE